MFFKIYFVNKENLQMIFEASTRKNYLPAEGFHFLKVSKLNLAFLKLKRNFFKLHGSSEDLELTRLKAHLFDLMELNASLFEKRKDQYWLLKEEITGKTPKVPQEKIESFLNTDLELLSQRARELFDRYLKSIQACKEMNKLHIQKAELISNTFLLSYKVKTPYDF